jgi:hypothetical protein
MKKKNLKLILHRKDIHKTEVVYRGVNLKNDIECKMRLRQISDFIADLEYGFRLYV